ncbi:MAG: hypothetical protein ACI82S_002698 [Patiriisocius sp.]|jgi:hypothetical protein
MKVQSDVVGFFLSDLNIDLNMESDPKIIQDIIENDMMLSNCQAFMNVFKTEFDTPVDLSEMIRTMSQGLYTSHPAIIEFIQHINNEKTFSNTQDLHSVIVKMINYIYVLNRLLEQMYSKPYWSTEIFDFVISVRKNYGIRENSLYCLIDSYKISKNWFLAVKIASVNFVIQRYLGRLSRYADKPIKNSGYFGQILWRSLLNINILEAALRDALCKRGKNAKAGLILVMFNNRKMNNDAIMRFGHSQEWASLYQTWNLSFITYGLPHLDTMYPKLIAPIVANAEPDTYIYKRVIALMLTFSWLLIHIKKQRVDKMAMSQNAELADVWGEINLQYAKKMYLTETGKEYSGAKGVCTEYIRRLCCWLHIKVLK